MKVVSQSMFHFSLWPAQKWIRNKELFQFSVKSAVVLVKGTKTYTGSTIPASNNRAGRKSTIKLKANQLVPTRTFFSNSFRESKKPEPDQFSEDYSDDVGKDYHLVYALHNFDIGCRFSLGLCVSVPLIFLQCICTYVYQCYKELEYTSNNLQEVFSNCVEIINHLPHSFIWIFVIAYITLIGAIGHHVFVKNSIGRLYYSSKQDRYIAIVFKYGFKRKIAFSRKDIVRKPVFFEKVIQKTGINVGEKERYFVYEKYFKTIVDNNRFFSEVASTDYLDEINRSHRSRPK